MSASVELYAVDADERPALVMPAEEAYVTETTTGLRFREDTPIEVWGEIVSRLTRQRKRIEWAIGDALRFGERRYGDTYAQWADETGLSENTLATMKWVAGAIEPSRRREDIGWSHHREVAGIDDPAMQDRLLEQAADRGLTRWEVRQEVKRVQEDRAGRSVNADGEPMCSDDLVWSPGLDDLTAEARAALESHAPGGRHRLGYVQGWISSLIWSECRDAFIQWGGPE